MSKILSEVIEKLKELNIEIKNHEKIQKEAAKFNERRLNCLEMPDIHSKNLYSLHAYGDNECECGGDVIILGVYTSLKSAEQAAIRAYKDFKHRQLFNIRHLIDNFIVDRLEFDFSPEQTIVYEVLHNKDEYHNCHLGLFPTKDLVHAEQALTKKPTHVRNIPINSDFWKTF